MKQTISNACGTVAMIHSVANTMEQVNLDNGHLKDFLESTREKSPEERATELEGNVKICEVLITLRVRVKQLLRHLKTMSITTLLHLWKKMEFCGIWMDAKQLLSIVDLRQKRNFYRTQLSSARRTWIVIPTISTLL